MPNTLCHIAIQTPATKIFCRDSNFLLIVVACTIPDIPWIMQRILLQADIFNPYDLRLYFSAQASFFFCLLPAAALAALSSRSTPVFAIAAWNALLHLLLDASQIKWANGIHILAPLSWEPLHFGIFWPEHILWRLLTIGGVFTILYYWITRKDIELSHPVFSRKRVATAVFFLSLYGAGPACFTDSIEQAGMYSIRTLRNTAERPGKYVEFDRTPFDSNSGTIRTFAGEQLFVDIQLPKTPGSISIKGRFSTEKQILVTDSHYHSGFRDYASITGLFMACALLLHSLLLSRKKNLMNH